MSAIHQTEHDVEGLQVALRELFEESFLADATGDLQQLAGPEDLARMEDDLPARTLSPGYYRQAAYLLDLASAIERGTRYSASQLSRSDVRGLEALKRARQGFEGDHPQCPGCGVRQQSKYGAQCSACKTKFGGRG